MSDKEKDRQRKDSGLPWEDEPRPRGQQGPEKPEIRRKDEDRPEVGRRPTTDVAVDEDDEVNEDAPDRGGPHGTPNREQPRKKK